VKAPTLETQIVPAHGPEHVETVRELFREYAASLAISLCFQHFEEELASLPGKYAPPAGRLLLALDRGTVAGCVALRPLASAPGVCEMKRLYVRPAFRSRHIGRLLATAVVQAAAETGYHRMVLDTLASMREALSLYHSLGFQPIAPYYDNPSSCAVFMALEIRPEIAPLTANVPSHESR
jgi:ribosomal protein S18 acetylase RimI-like enzyme